jgi:acyl-coenzyme A synthetase/AMP-(fatty) acid ligase
LEWQRNLPDTFFVNQYGPTEATASCTYYYIDHIVHENEKLPIGQPYDNYKVFLLNDDLSPTLPGNIGEICISGIPLALGYYNDRENTEKSFINNPNIKEYQERIYRTGDYGRVRADGMLEFHGRRDRQIKHLGHRVELDEIEYAVNRLDSVKECLVLYDKEAEIICLFYSGTIDKKKLVIELRKSLPGFMIPRKLIPMDDLPRLSNGKIDMEMINSTMAMFIQR